MFWTALGFLERHLLNAFVTVLLLLFCAGLSWWIWQDRFNRSVPGRGELVELRGSAASPKTFKNSKSVWFRFQMHAGELGGLAAPEQLRLHAHDFEAVESALAKGPVQVVAWVVRAELGRGPREEPPSVLQLQAGDRVLVPFATGQAFQAERAANARLSAWIAAFGIAVSLVALAAQWARVLLR